MNKFHKAFSIFFLILLTISGCGGGGSDDNGGGTNAATPGTDACGVIGLNPRIINGTTCGSSQTSSIVRVVSSTGEEIGNCTGTMIEADKVLTAAHCFSLDVTGAGILVGDNVADATLINATQVIRHGDFDLQAGRFDVAIMILERNAGLPTLPILVGRNISEGEIISIFGYGQDETGEFNGFLESGQMKVSSVGNLLVNADFNGEGSNTCFGDSGGPAIASLNGQVGVFGVTSFGIQENCLEGDTTIFTNLQAEANLAFIASVAPNAGIL